jgi:type IV secretory pathway TraG/TraD family ATPase VirD4
MSPAALRAMPDNQVLYLFANRRPALLTVTPYYKNRDFERRAKTSAHRPSGLGVGQVEVVPL